MFHSAPYLEKFYDRISASAKKITDDYEIILVNDGSPDNSLDVAISLYEKDNKVKIIDLSCNFNHHKAIMTGLSYAKGDIIFVINCDLEEAPENIELFYKKLLDNSDCDLVYGVLENRKGNIFNRFYGYYFYKLMNFMSDIKFDRFLASSRMMSKRYIESLLKFEEREVFFAGLLCITGYKQLPLEITSSYKGSSSYNLRRRISLGINAIISFSNKPLIYVFYCGLLISLASLIFALDIIFQKIFYGINIVGWASLIVSIWMIGGLIILFLGIVGIYIAKVFIEIKRRPYTIIKNIYDKS